MGVNKKPDFLVVGAAKSGTTSLFNYLNQHPDIYIPDVKECRFFSQLPKNFKGLGAEYFPNSGITNEKNYFELFKGFENKICGDISNDYLYYYEESIKNIKKYLGNKIQIIIILRNSIDRAYSNYMHAIRDDWENLTFEKAIIEESQRIASNWGWPYHYIQVGFYYEQVKAYLDSFENVRIYLYEDLKDIDFLINDLFQFLKVKKIKVKNLEKIWNVSGYPKNRIIHKVVNNEYKIKKIIKPIVNYFFTKDFQSRIKNFNLQKTPLDEKTRLYLEKIYKENFSRLSELIERDLSSWIKN